MSKRIFDIAVTLLVMIVFSPLFFIVAILVAILLGRPVIFRQQRPGLGGVPFDIRKFRTIRDLRDEQGKPLPDEQRLTRLGRFLRSTSLDELPELWNVLRGEMSLVGPRPLRMQYLPLYTEDQARRHLVKPGITGPAQISGRNALTWEERFALDIHYVDHHNLRMDFGILLRTIGTLLFRRGISHEGHATMPEFGGTDPPDRDLD